MSQQPKLTNIGNMLQAWARSTTGADLGKKIEAGGNKFMREGEHYVRVAAVDCNQAAANNQVKFKYQNEAGQEQNDNLFLMELNQRTGQPELNWKVQATLGMLVPSTEAYDAVIGELAAGNFHVFELFTGMTGKIVLARGKGYGPAEPQSDGTYVVRNVAKADETYVGTSVADAQQQAERGGLKKAFINVVRYLATDGEANIKLFAQGMANLHKPKAPTTPFQTGKGVAGFGRAV